MSKLSISNKKIDTILVLDFGSQYTQLIARRIRESHVYSEILPWDIDESKIAELNPKGIILSGGPNSVTETYTPRVPQFVFDIGIPILGICYGMQTLAEQMGGHVISVDQKEFGHSELEVVSESLIFKNLDKFIICFSIFFVILNLDIQNFRFLYFYLGIFYAYYYLSTKKLL